MAYSHCIYVNYTTYSHVVTATILVRTTANLTTGHLSGPDITRPSHLPFARSLSLSQLSKSVSKLPLLSRPSPAMCDPPRGRIAGARDHQSHSFLFADDWTLGSTGCVGTGREGRS